MCYEMWNKYNPITKKDEILKYMVMRNTLMWKRSFHLEVLPPKKIHI